MPVPSEVAIDCECVGDLQDKLMLARVSIVDAQLKCIYDKYVKPTKAVGNYRTQLSGIRPQDLVSGMPLDVVQQEVSRQLNGKVVIGHGLRQDFEALGLPLPQNIRDGTNFKPFLDKNGQPQSLKALAKEILGESIQNGPHNSVEDAKASMQLYLKHKKDWYN